MVFSIVHSLFGGFMSSENRLCEINLALDVPERFALDQIDAWNDAVGANG
jgi:hypothetical protein